MWTPLYSINGAKQSQSIVNLFKILIFYDLMLRVVIETGVFLCFCTMGQFGGAASVNTRIPWWWHLGSVETYSKETVRRFFLICCWPCILVIINFKFQLIAQYFISIIMFLYMFRATLCPSSGGPLRIYNISDWHRTRCYKYAGVLLKMGTELPKHVEEHSYWNKICCIKLELEVN